MKKYYYITFNWNRRLFYDGYFVRTDNDGIIGFTDDSILAGDGSKIEEFSRPTIKRYPITKEMFAEYEAEGGFTMYGRINDEKFVISLKQVKKIDKSIINHKINIILPRLPEEIQKIFIESYLQRG